MRASGDVLSYLEMCQEEGVNLQQGMNFRLRGGASVILMSIRPGAPYADHSVDEGRVLIYEGHDVPRQRGGPDPKTLDQELETPSGWTTQNGRFFAAARRVQMDGERAELVRVYEKVRTGISLQSPALPPWRGVYGGCVRAAASLKAVCCLLAFDDGSLRELLRRTLG